MTRLHLYRVTRLDPADGPKRLDGSDGAVILDVDTGIPGLLLDAPFGGVSTSDAEIAERVLVQMFDAMEWEPAAYRIEVFGGYEFDADTSRPFVTVERDLPLHPAYAALPSWPRDNTTVPRDYVMSTLTKAYPGASLGLLAEYGTTFRAHHHVEIGTPELTRVTGWTPPQGWTRPLAMGSEYHTIDQVPNHLR